MQIPKKYYHDKAILALLGVNLALMILAVFNVLLGINPSENPTSIISYRNTTKIGQVSGATTELYRFAIFSLLVTIISIILSIRFFSRRRQISVGVLGMCVLLNILTIIIFNALTKTL